MNSFLEYFILFPIVGFLVSLVLPRKNETLISWTAFITMGIQLAGVVVYLGFWFWSGMPHLNFKDYVLFETAGYEFYIDFYFDHITAVYMFVGAFLTFLVTVYSRYYMHRESGYKRFFNTILFFYIGYNLIVLAGNMLGNDGRILVPFDCFLSSAIPARKKCRESFFCLSHW
jgi:NADH-quinone oxidoreductase subunit L